MKTVAILLVGLALFFGELLTLTIVFDPLEQTSKSKEYIECEEMGFSSSIDLMSNCVELLRTIDQLNKTNKKLNKISEVGGIDI